MKKTLFSLLALLSVAFACKCFAGKPSRDVYRIIDRVNTYWQTNQTPKTRAFWDHAAYHTGNMEVYKLTKNQKYLQYSLDWANHNQWSGARSKERAKWKFNYGETNEHVLFGDWQICFQTYIDLYNIDPADYKIARAKEVMGYQVATDTLGYWWWVDGLYMVMPVMTKMYNLTKDEVYLDRLNDYLQYAISIMYDKDEALFYRDSKYIYPKHKSANGGKDFWARGDGWVFAGLSKVLQDLPKDSRYYPQFVSLYQAMAKSIAACQQPGGYWSRSMLDASHAPGPETSGTAFFTYGFLWGVNNGIFDKKSYAQTIDKGWKYLVETALQPDGRVGYVQPIGEKAIVGQIVDANSTANFGVGAFLLAACEMTKYK